MKKFICIILIAISALFYGCSFDDDYLWNRADEYKSRIEVLVAKAETLQAQIDALSVLTNGNVITSVTQNSDGKYVISYKDDSDTEYSVIIASMEDLLDVPILGVRLDEDEGVYYWTLTTDGDTDWLYVDDARVPVRGNTPTLSVDSEGYWTVDGERIYDSDGAPIAANTESSSIFKDASYSDGVFTITLGNGEVITLQVFNTLNLKLGTTATVSIVDETVGYTISYELSGESADNSIVAIAKETGGVNAVLDEESQSIAVTFGSDFGTASTSYLIVMAYDLADNVIIKPVFFTKMVDSSIYISSADELVQFATDVNNGTIVDGMSAYVTADIDMKNVSSWTPIGNGTFSGSAFSGACFSGTFDGQGHTIDNLTITNDAVEANQTVGLFGVVKNATIRNVIMGRGSSINATSAGRFSVSPIVAAAGDGTTIKDCCNYASVTVATGAEDKRIEAGGVVGGTYSDDGAIQISGCINYGEMISTNTLSTNNGANGIQIAGILGFAGGSSSGSNYTTVRNCSNYGELIVQAARAGGIAASLNYRGAIVDCVNNASVTNTDVTASNCRTGGIGAFMNNNSYIDGCTNRGDVTFAVGGDTVHGYAAGIVCQMQAASVSVTNCTNYGTILSDIIRATTNKYIAIICANTNKTSCTISGNKIGGKIGPYTEDDDYSVIEITADNYTDYIFFHLSGTDPTYEDNVFAGDNEEDAVGIATIDDLLAFRDAVNNGLSTAEWEDSEGVVNLLADIDMSSVTDWTPIGNGVPTVASNISTVEVDGAVFSGVFDGGGYSLLNIGLRDESIVESHTFGIFGTVSSGEVRNLNIGTSSAGGSFTVSTSAITWAGTIAGLVIDSEITDCTSYASISYDSVSSSGGRVGVGAMIGLCFANSEGNIIQNLINNGSIKAEANGNTSNGLANAPQVGGIIGITSANTTNKPMNTVEYCYNYGDVTSSTARTAGIIGAANSYTLINSCTNYGDQTNSIGSTGRLGGITCVMGTSCSMQECVNYGDVISTSSDGARVGGLLSLPNNATNSFSGCASYGQIVSNSSYRGVFFGYNAVASTWVNCHCAGYLGVYNSGTYVWDSYDEDNMTSYLGPQGSTTASMSNITYDMGASDGSAATGPDATLRILCIGNSFTKDAVEHLPGIISASGIETVKIVHMYYGGRTIPEYYSGYSTVDDYTCYTMYTSSDTWISYKGSTLQEVVQSDAWDIVTIQEHTGNYRAWSWTDEEKEAIEGLIGYIKEDQGENVPKFEYIMSQAYYDMSKIGSSSQAYITFATQAEMFEVITTQAKKVLDETSVDEIIPTGTVLQNLRTSSLNNDMDLTRDGYHMDYGISRYAAACCVFEMIVSPSFDNIKLDSNTYRYDVSSTTNGSYSTPVTDENQPIALLAARYAIADPFNVTDMSNTSSDSGDIGDIDYENDTEKE